MGRFAIIIFGMFLIPVMLWSGTQMLEGSGFESMFSQSATGSSTLFEQVENSSIQVAVRIDSGADIQEFENIEASNALEALRKATISANLETTEESAGDGNVVTRIGQNRNSDSKQWVYFVNGRAGEGPAEEAELEDGDIVEWRYVNKR